jgi:carbon monoxide dehydrogenase subunit G
MDMKGEFLIPLPQALVWRALNDAEILKASIPGCDELIRDSDTSFKGKISAAVGPVRAKFAGTATLSDIDAPNGYKLTGNGSGGAAGMVKGGATVRLIADGDATILHYEAHAQVAGKLAQIGSRLVDMAISCASLSKLRPSLRPRWSVPRYPKPRPNSALFRPNRLLPLRRPKPFPPNATLG